ncbi:MAG TPA: dipeptidase [Gemmatimonadaceae bacterium]|nr:dipeptidase [Gemmatimonadaceae bacterium]
MALIDRVLAYTNAHRQRFVRELTELVRFPSVSADPAHAKDVRACASWLAAHLASIGATGARVVETNGHPIVVAVLRASHPDRPTVLVYGHYDVQPAERATEWTSPPFAPVVRDGSLFGRGSCDDKGQLFTHLKALEAWMRVAGDVPVNVICMIEGEEEIGSAALRSFLTENRLALRADVALMSDMLMRGPDRPTITYAVRGEIAMEIELRGTDRDLHSGQFGGAIHDPAQALAELLASLHDARGRIAVPGFYDRVRPVSAAERRYMARVAPDDKEILMSAGAGLGWGERGFSLYERTTSRPSLSINGISAGYTGTGHKAVIPARASAKLSARLVPDQVPDEILALLTRHLEHATPPTMRISATTLLSVPPAQVDLDSAVMRAARESCAAAFGRAPVFVRLGGTIPIVSTLEALGIPAVMIGFALPDDRIHASDEHFELANFHRGIATSARFLGLLGQAGVLENDHRLSLPRRQGRRPHSAVGH